MPKPTFRAAGITLYRGDCLSVLPRLPAASIDSVITDPPYHLSQASRNGSPRVAGNGPCGRHRVGERGFMGKTWDGGGVAFDPATWAAVLRVAKPGSMLLAFGGSRTFHRLACAIEDAGWEIRDTLCWLYGQGFPKSLDISKAIDKAAGVDTTDDPASEAQQRRSHFGDSWREADEGHNKRGPRKKRDPVINQLAYHANERNPEGIRHLYEPLSDAAKLWNGWGTALKPGWEPIILAMKPLDQNGTFAQNALAHGVAGLNIDGARIGVEKRWPTSESRFSGWKKSGDSIPTEPRGLGRWPANVVLSHTPECRCVGKKKVASGTGPKHIHGLGYSSAGKGAMTRGYADPNGTETVEAWDCPPHCPVRMLDEQSGDLKAGGAPKVQNNHHPTSYSICGKPTLHAFYDSGGASRFFHCSKASRSDRGPGNDHPTVKPLRLIEWLCRLTATPTGGIVLDPFLGSGTTALACLNTGRRCIGIEKDRKYLSIAIARIKALLAETPLFAEEAAT